MIVLNQMKRKNGYIYIAMRVRRYTYTVVV